MPGDAVGNESNAPSKRILGDMQKGGQLDAYSERQIRQGQRANLGSRGISAGDIDALGIEELVVQEGRERRKQQRFATAAQMSGINKATGKYISFLDADDYWLPNKIEHQIKIIKEKNLDFIHSSYCILDQQDRILGKFLSKPIKYHELIKSCDIGLSTVMLSSKISKENLFSNITTKEDYVCWLNIVKKITT